MTKPDYILDISSLAPPAGSAPAPSPAPPQAHRPRPWLAIRWKCCNVYCRVYRQPEAASYEGRCPKCGRSISIPVGPGGTSSRFFEAE